MTRIDVANQIINCTACDLHTQCTLPVPYSGEPCRVAAIGEAPGVEEDTVGAPFVGPAGQLLRAMLTEADITEPVAYINTVSCFPHDTPTWEHIQACDTNKWAQINEIAPTHLLLLGRVALKGIRPDLDIKHGRARPFTHNGHICFAVYHPAAGLRNRTFEQTIRDELVVFRRLLDIDDWRNLIPGSCAACPIDAVWFEDAGIGWCRVHLPAEQAAAFNTRETLLAAEADAARRRDAALAQVAAGADAAWTAQAWDTLVSYLQAHPTFFVDDLWEAGLVEPREARALGPVVLRAAREGLMRKSGVYRKSVRSNLTEKPVWTSLVYKQAEASV